MTGPRILSLFSGYGGLDLAVLGVLGGQVMAHAEVEPAACRVLEHRFPGVPNLGDVTAVDWSAVGPVDMLVGGFPCQDVSHAGKRAGLRPDTRSGLWSQMAYAVEMLRPALVVAENVRGLLSAEAHGSLEPCPWCVGDGADSPLRALGAVLGDLADIGYDASWCGVRAADVGAPHGRFRVFIAAWPAAGDAGRGPVQRRPDGRGVGGAEGPRVGEGLQRQRRGDAAGDAGPSAADARGETGDVRRGSEAGPARRRRLRPGLGDGGAPSSANAAGPRWRPATQQHEPVGGSKAAGHRSTEPRGRGIANADTDRVGRRRRAEAGTGRRPDRSQSRSADARPGADATADTGGDGRSWVAPAHDHDGGHAPWDEPVGRAAADPDDAGRGEHGRPVAVRAELAAAERRGADAAADAQGDGRDEGRPEPARVEWGPDAAIGGAGTCVCCDLRDEWVGHPGGWCAAGRHWLCAICIGRGHGENCIACEPAADAEGGVEPGWSEGDDAAALVGARARAGGGDHAGHPAAGADGLGGNPGPQWGPYAAAVHRWEQLTRPAPPPTEPGAKGQPRLSPAFVEWMMGLPAGWVTDVPGVTRNEQLKLLGNGVVPQQAAYALRLLLREIVRASGLSPGGIETLTNAVKAALAPNGGE